DGGRHRVDFADMRLRWRSDRRHALWILFYAPQSEPEWRIDELAHHQKHHKQHDKRIDVSGVSPHVEFKDAQQLADANSLQTVAPAGQPARLVGCFQHQETHAKRYHEESELREARDDEADQVAGKPR